MWKPQVYSNKVKKSFLLNMQVQPLNRMSLNIQAIYKNSDHCFYLSQNKLQCFLSYSFSVPSRKLKFSRFFINKAAEQLTFGGYQKY